MAAPVVVLFAAALSFGPSGWQSPAPSSKDETATQCYQRFRAAAQSATSMGDITPFWSAELLHDFSLMPDADKASTLDMIKRTESRMTDVQVVKETPTANGVRLSLEGIGAGGKPMTGTVDLVKEQGSWKLVEAEQWTPKSAGPQSSQR